MSANGIYVEVDQNDVKKVMSKLKNLDKAASRLKNAINRTATYAKKELVVSGKTTYTIKGRMGKDITIQRANAAHLDATVKSEGRPPTIKNFKYSMPKAGGRAQVLTASSLKNLVTSAGAAFVPRGGKAAGLMVSRRSKEKTPTQNGVHALRNIHVLHGPSVPKMIEQIWTGKQGAKADLEAKVREKLHEEMEKEIAKLM